MTTEAARPFEAHSPQMRPPNPARTIYHMLTSSAVVVLVVLAPADWLPPIAVVFAVTAWTLEALRHLFPRFNRVVMAVFGWVAHPHEAARINSGTWYVSGMVILAYTTPTWACAVAVAVLGWGDPVAALVGRRWGKTALLNGRTLQGTLAFVAAGAAAAGITLLIAYPETPRLAGIALGAAAAGGLAELVSRRLDDNFTIPLATALACAVVAGL